MGRVEMLTFALPGAAYIVHRIGKPEQWRGRHLGSGGAGGKVRHKSDYLEANMSKQIGHKKWHYRWYTAAVLVLTISLAGAACSPSTADAPSQAPPATPAAVPTAAQPTAAPTLAAPTLAPTASPAPSSTTQPTDVPPVTAGPEAQGLIAGFKGNGNLLTFHQDGRFQWYFNDLLVDYGTFTVAGDQVTLIDAVQPGHCSPTLGPGVYRWELIGDNLLLTMVQDECHTRANFLVNTPWIKVL
jgi:hypothetical protein